MELKQLIARESLLGYKDIVLQNGEIEKKYVASRSGSVMQIYKETTEELFIDMQGIPKIPLDVAERLVFNIQSVHANITIVHIWRKNDRKEKKVLSLKRDYLYENLGYKNYGYRDDIRETFGIHALVSEHTGGYTLGTTLIFEKAVIIIKGRCYEIAQYYIKRETIMVDIILNTNKYERIEDLVIQRHIIDMAKGISKYTSEIFDYTIKKRASNIIWSENHFDDDESVLILLEKSWPLQLPKDIQGDELGWKMKDEFDRRRDKKPYYGIETEAKLVAWSLERAKMARLRIYGEMQSINYVDYLNTDFTARGRPDTYIFIYHKSAWRSIGDSREELSIFDTQA